VVTQHAFLADRYRTAMEKNGISKPKLTVFTVSWFSTELIGLLLRNLNDKAEFPERIEYIIIDNTNGQDPSVQRLTQTGLPVKLYANDTQGKTGSFGHACGLNFAMSKLKTEFALVVDPDVYVFKDNWDSFCVEAINKNNYSAVGTTYPRWQLGKYHNFPNPVFCFFRTKDFRELRADWTPYSKNRIVTFSNFVKRQILRCGILIDRKMYQKCRFIRRPFAVLEDVIGVCSHDTGWRIADKAKKKDVTSLLLKAVLPDEAVAGSGTTVFKRLAGSFELYYYQNKPFLTHKYSTCSRVWKTAKGSDTGFWRQCIERFQNEIISRNTSKN